MNKMVIEDLEKMGRLLTYLEKGKTSEEIKQAELGRDISLERNFSGREIGELSLIKNRPGAKELDYQTLIAWGDVNPDIYARAIKYKEEHIPRIPHPRKVLPDGD